MLTQEKIRKTVQTIAPQYGIDRVYLFGSYARGDATLDSDVDLRIVGGEFNTLLDLIGLRLDLQEALGISVDTVRTDRITDSFYSLIKEEEVLIYAQI